MLKLPPSIRKPLGHIRRTLETPFYYIRGKRILARYSGHYRTARRCFNNNEAASQTLPLVPRDVGVRVVPTSPAEKENWINLPADYLKTVDIVADQAKALLDNHSECTIISRNPLDRSPVKTTVENDEILSIQLKDPLMVEGLEALCAPIIHELEQKVYGSFATVDKVYIYRSPFSRQSPHTSWLWHFDNHPHEILKVMIYLSDVGSQNAPFAYLRSSITGKAIPGSPLAPLFGHSRIQAKTLTRLMLKGAEAHSVVGPKGTMIIFDNNVIHRANQASAGHRDVVIFQVRPVSRRINPYIDRRWTGSFQHVPFNLKPTDLTPSSAR